MRDLRNAGDRTALGYGFAVAVGCYGPRDGGPDGQGADGEATPEART